MVSRGDVPVASSSCIWVVSTPASTGCRRPIAGTGDRAGWRFIEFFTASIRNPNTRRGYGRAVSDFFRWCHEHRVRDLAHISPTIVAAYVEQLQQTDAKPSVKQHLAAVRMLFDWLVTGQVIPVNPAHSVRGPKYVVPW